MTLVYQSYRTTNVPEWIKQCLQSVKNWTASKEYEYRFVDDELFEYAPQWYRQKVRHNVQLVSDLSRLVLARGFLEEGYERVIWIDADVLIFDSEKFILDTSGGASFCREVWIDEDLQGNMIHQEKINNSVSVFYQQNAMLDFYIDACKRIVSSSAKASPVLVGTSFLSALHKIYPFDLITSVGILSPALVYGLLKEQRTFLDFYLKRHGSEIFAANLCGSMVGNGFRNLEIRESTMEKVVEKMSCFRAVDLLSGKDTR